MTELWSCIHCTTIYRIQQKRAFQTHLPKQKNSRKISRKRISGIDKTINKLLLFIYKKVTKYLRILRERENAELYFSGGRVIENESWQHHR